MNPTMRRLIVREPFLDPIHSHSGAERFIEAVDQIPRILTPSHLHSSETNPDGSFAIEASHIFDIEDALPLPLPFHLNEIMHYRLNFLARFRDFLNAMKEGMKWRAKELVVDMFSRGLVPRGFWGVLLMDCTVLLEGELLELKAVLRIRFC